MLSNTSKNEDVDFQAESSLALELQDFKELVRCKKKKNVEAECAFTMFEKALSQLKIDSDNKQILKKLIQIEKVIKEKIFLLNEYENNKSHENVEFFKERTSSNRNLDSEDVEKNARIGLCFTEFLKRVNCPFCSELQTDKIKLIEHLDEDCKPRIKKMFNEKYHLALSVFQILPNDTFKCNICPSAFLPDIEKYFEHLQKNLHIKAYDKAAKLKNYTEFLFCACCKVQVANNYTQIDFHMKHEVHKGRKEKTFSSKHFVKRGIHYVYVGNKNFKCLRCPLSIYKSLADFIKHFEKSEHVKKVKENQLDLNLLFCEVCSKELPIFEVFKHFMSSDHTDEKNKIKDNYELCFFCGFVCSDLMELKLHMKSDCSVICSIKKQNPKSKISNDLKKDTLADKSNVDGGNIIVKDFREISALFSYFQRFGQISSLEMYGDKHVRIKFVEKSIAASILLLKDKLNINGIGLKITTDDELLNSRDEMITSKESQILSESENSLSSFDSSESDDNSSEDESSSDIRMLQRDKLPSLFQRVTSHLVNISQKLDSAAEVKSILDCLKIVTGEDCSLVGFAGCGLSFPVESINLYYPLRINSPNKFLTETSSVDDTALNSAIFLRKLRQKMCTSELWQNVISSARSFPYIKCQHKETQKICTVTCAESAMLLTEMLRDCLKEKNLVLSFCALIKFWLTVHELKIRKFEYVVISLIIFFLIRNDIVKLSKNKYFKKEDVSLIKNSHDKLLKENSSGEKNNQAFDLQKLFYKFLEFLNTFDFDEYAICLPLPLLVPKAAVFEKLKAITESPNYNEMPKSSMYITEINSLHNLAFYVREEHLKPLLRIVKSSLKNIKF